MGKALAVGQSEAGGYGWKSEDISPEAVRDAARDLEALVSVTLYLCSLAAEIRDPNEAERTPTKPAVKRTKKGDRMFPAARATLWEVGYRMAAALRNAMEDDRKTVGAGTGSGARSVPRPHIRRAHWHSYWYGPKKDPAGRRLVARWMPPIPVKLESPDHLAPAIRPVK